MAYDPSFFSSEEQAPLAQLLLDYIQVRCYRKEC